MSDLMHHLRYNHWATGRVLETVRPLSTEQFDRPLGGSYGSLRGTLTHIYQGDRIWWDRLQGKSSGLLSEYRPPEGFGAWEEEWLALLDRFVEWGQTTNWDRMVAYQDIKGNPHQNLVWEILLHLVNHGSYHRGQVAHLLRQLDVTPASSDLIYYYRALPR